MEIFEGAGNSTLYPNGDPDVANAGGQSIFERLCSKAWDTRAAAYEDLLTETNKHFVFDIIDRSPAIFLHEQTSRGQEYALRAIHEWLKGLVSFSLTTEYILVHEVVANYGYSSNERIKTLACGLFDIIAERFGGTKLMAVLSKLLSDYSKDALNARIRDTTSKVHSKGGISRQLMGCLRIISALAERYKEDITMDALVPRVSEIAAVAAHDRPLREECYSFLEEAIRINEKLSVESLGLPEPQAKELRSRLSKTPDLTTSCLDSVDTPYRAQESDEGLHESVSTSASPRPPDEHVDLFRHLGGIEWLITAEKSLKWQDRQLAWSRLNGLLANRPKVVHCSDDILHAIIRTIKSELNVPITVELCGIVHGLITNTSHSISTVLLRQMLSVLTSRMKDKSAPVQRAVSQAVVGLVQAAPQIFDQRWIEADLKPVSMVNRKESIDFIEKVLPYMSCGNEVNLMKHIAIPCMSDSSIRDSAVLLTKRILAQSASPDAGISLDQCLFELRKALSAMSSARCRVLEEAIGISVTVAEKKPAGAPRPATANIGRRIPTRSDEQSGMRRSTSTPRTTRVVSERLIIQLRENATESALSGRTLPSDAISTIKLASLFRAVLVPNIDSERVRQHMFDLRNVGPVIRAVTAWIEFVRSRSEWKAIVDILFHWMRASLSSHHDNLQLLNTMVDLVDAIVSSYEGPFNGQTLRIIMALLTPRVAKNVRVSAIIRQLREGQPMHVETVIMESTKKCLMNNKLARKETNDGREVRGSMSSRSAVRPDAKKTSPRAESPIEHIQGSKDDIVDKCQRLSEAVNEGTTSSKTVIETVTRSLQSVLNMSESEPRQAILSLLHKISRTPAVWTGIRKSTLCPFMKELLTLVSDKALRTAEPETWADINLSVVHAIANSDRPTAYAALLELGSEDRLQSLVIRCIDKINRSIPEYLANDGEKSLGLILTALHSHIESLMHRREEAIIIQDECIMACLNGVCSASSLVEVGEFIGMHVKTPQERLIWKKLLKIYSATEKRRKSINE